MLNVGMARRALAGEVECGDACGHWPNSGGATLAIADGLGHGPEAAHASRAAMAYLAEHLGEPLPSLFAGCDQTLHKTRGAAMSIAVLDRESHSLRYAAVGNTRALLVQGSGMTLLPSTPGIVGGGYRSFAVQTVALVRAHLLILCSDGIRQQLDLSFSAYDRGRDPQSLAEHFLDQGALPTDDAAVLVYRDRGDGGFAGVGGSKPHP